MKKITVILLIVVILGLQAYAFETDDPELKQIMADNPQVGPFLDANPDYAKLAKENPTLFKEQLKEVLENANTPEAQQKYIQENPEIMVEQLKKVQQEVNAQAEQIPGIVKFFIGKERINFKIDTMVIGIYIVKGKIEDIKVGSVENPTMNLITTMNDIIEISNQRRDLASALAEGKVKVEPLRFITKVKLFVIKKVYKVAAKKTGQ